MAANRPNNQTDLIAEAIVALKSRLPSAWAVKASSLPAVQPGRSDKLDGAVDLVASNGARATMAVEAKLKFGPRDIDSMRARMFDQLRLFGSGLQPLVVSEWLSPRTCELLIEQRFNYLDMTGNAYVKLENPAVFISSEGAKRDPSPVPRGSARVKGSKAGRLIRFLVDVRPPYGVREVAAAAGINPGYASRLLDTLYAEALVERSSRGRVEAVDITGLIKRWADSYDIFTSNRALSFISPAGPRAFLNDLKQARAQGRWAVTGSFAAGRLAPVAGPALLVLYCDDPKSFQMMNLLPADEGANLMLLEPFDSVVWEGASDEEGLWYAAPSQVAVDCLTGDGRMPSEGEALLNWMIGHESEWRLPSINEPRRISAGAR